MVNPIQVNQLIVSIVILFGFGEIRAVADESALDGARDVFAVAVSRSLKLKRKEFNVIPVATPSDVYSKLTTGSLYAWTALDRDERVLVNGFAGTEEGNVAFERFHDGGLAGLLKACHVLSRKEQLPLDQLVDRVAFCLNRAGSGEMIFDSKIYQSSGFTPPDAVKKPALRSQKSGEQLIYFTMIPGNTGTWEVWKISVTILPDYNTIISRDPL